MLGLRRRRHPAHDSLVANPTTEYAWNDGTAIAYQMAGAIGPELLFIPGSVTHIEMLWQQPRVSRFLKRLGSFCRLVLMDPRGLGLSDRLTEVPTIDERVADLLAVLDAAGCERATLFGNADTGPACIAAAALHPDRVSGLILCGTFARATPAEGYPWGWTQEEWEDFQQRVKAGWGREETFEEVDPSVADDEDFRQWYGTMMRVGASPSAMLLLGHMTQNVDVRPLLPQVAVPTLVMHRTADPVNPVGMGRYVAERIPGARWVELPGEDFALWAGDIDSIADEVQEFMTGRRSGAEPTRVVATVMFTDVVQSTERAGAMGDRAWADLLESHHARGARRAPPFQRARDRHGR